MLDSIFKPTEVCNRLFNFKKLDHVFRVYLAFASKKEIKIDFLL